MNQNTNTQHTTVASTRNIIPLEAIHVAAPCKASWAKMQGDDASRFCGSCEKHVYNLSAMTRLEAEKLVAEKEGKLCVRFYQREDGTMLTSDCRVGVAALSVRLRESKFSPLRVLAMAACAIGALLPASTRAHAAGFVDSLRAAPGIGKIVNCVSPQATAGAPAVVMGKMPMRTKPKATPKPKPIVMGKPLPRTHTMGMVAPPHVVKAPKRVPRKTTKRVAPKIKAPRRAKMKTLARPQ